MEWKNKKVLVFGSGKSGIGACELLLKKEAQPVPAAGGGAKPLATFRVSVLFRQNASWQGTLLWTERAVDAQFRSVLELIRLLDSALTEELEGTYDR